MSTPRTLARIDDHKYVEISREAWEVIYIALCRELPGHPGTFCPVMHGGNATYGRWVETYWGTKDCPVLYSMMAKEGEQVEDHFFVVKEYVYEDD